MSEEQYDNKQWSVEDFRRYHAGQMPVQEMHALEKASLDDPFLEDAMEGYAFTKTPIADIEELNKRLAPKKEEAKIIWYKQKGPAQLLRIAAMLVLFAGFSWLLYQNKIERKDEIASVNKPAEVNEKREPIIPDTIISNSTTFADSQNRTDVAALPKIKRNNTGIVKDNGDDIQNIALPPANNEADVATAMDVKSKESRSVAAAPAKSKSEEALSGKVSGVQVTPVNVITGRVVDKQGQPVGYATIKDQTNNQVTAANKDGYFSLNNIQNSGNVKIDVNAVGYTTTNISINPSNAANNIVLQEADIALNEVVVMGYEANRSKKSETASARGDSKFVPLNITSRLTLTNAIPIASWESYNPKLDELFKNSKQFDTTGMVILLFDLDPSGIAYNISVKKSLGASCDEEAIKILAALPAMNKIKKSRKAEAEIKF